MGRSAPPTDGDSESQSLGWAFFVGFVVVPGVSILLAVAAWTLTPGTPASCRLTTVRSWWLCPWARAFVTNGVFVTLVAAVVFVPLVTAVGLGRGVVQELRRR